MAKVASTAEYFDTLGDRFLADQAGGVSAQIQYTLSGDGGGEWTVTIENGEFKGVLDEGRYWFFDPLLRVRVEVVERVRPVLRAVQLPAWNEALGLPRPWDQQWSLRMQQVLAFETDLLEYGDLFDGSHVVEAKTAELRDAAQAELDEVRAFFYARQGRAHGFRFKDWGDHKSCLPSGTPAPTDQAIGTGDGTTTAFQLVKRYASGNQTWTRTITKPVAGTVKVYRDGVEATSGWSVDPTAGLVTFTTAPNVGVQITADFAKTLIDAEGLGDDEITDFLGVSFSVTDYVGHFFGPSSLESEDQILRLDRLLESLFKFRHLTAAWPTPGRPELDDVDVPVLESIEFLALDPMFDVNVGSLVSNGEIRFGGNGERGQRDTDQCKRDRLHDRGTDRLDGEEVRRDDAKQHSLHLRPRIERRDRDIGERQGCSVARFRARCTNDNRYRGSGHQGDRTRR